LAEANCETRDAERLTGGDPAADDGHEIVGGIAKKDITRRKASAQHFDNNVANDWEDVDVMVTVNEVRRETGLGFKSVEMPLDFESNLKPVYAAGYGSLDEFIPVGNTPFGASSRIGPRG
jgi:hypothetical protein